MKLKQQELFIFCVLLFITVITKQTVLERFLGIYIDDNTARYLSVIRALLNMFLGYIGLLKHETWWLKQGWFIFCLIILLAVFINIMAVHFIHRSVFIINLDILVSPFFYLAACLLPRLMRRYM